MKITGILLFCFLLSLSLAAQPKWKKKTPAKKLDLELFHSTMTANFPTTETLKKGDWEYEISHRFTGRVNDGFSELWGIDGGSRIRFGLSYALTDHLMIRGGRTNVQDNYDLSLKYKFLQLRNEALPMAMAIRLGGAWNSAEVSGRNRSDSKNFQFFSQLVVNTILQEKFAIGVVPSYVYNSDSFSPEKEYTFSLGNYYQYYFSSKYSAFVEYSPIISGYQGPIQFGITQKSFNSLSYGFDIETGGHFFRLLLTNNTRLNTSQFLVGGVRSVSDNEWSIGFNITRYL
ncbi:MAG: DUF5777 family beta-barrel protein [Calditrichia bacterium]